MLRFLERLRKRSRNERQSIAFGTAGVITAVIFFGWLASFAFSPTYERRLIPQSADPFNFDLFEGSLKGAADALKEGVRDVRQNLDSFNSEVRPSNSLYERTQNEESAPSQGEIGGEKEDTSKDIGSQGLELTPSGIELIEVRE